MTSRSSLAADRSGDRGDRWWGQMLRYGSVSAVALAVDMALFLALTGSDLGALSAAVAGYAVGLLVHFLLSSRFVFDAARTGKGRSRLFGEYALSGIAGILVTAATVAMLVEGAGLAPVPAKAVAVVLSFVAVFVIRRSIVFAARPA
ncbi:GtrA family protein [Phreatobacter sp. HK31-P]